ncbi:uncharacterized protein ACBT57_009691 [Dama dama]
MKKLPPEREKQPPAHDFLGLVVPRAERAHFRHLPEVPPNSRAQVNLAREPARRLPCAPEASRAQCVDTVLPLHCFLRTSAFFTTASPGMRRKWRHIFSRSQPRTPALETKCDLPAGARGGPLESGAGTSPRLEDYT